MREFYHSHRQNRLYSPHAVLVVLSDFPYVSSVESGFGENFDFLSVPRSEFVEGAVVILQRRRQFVFGFSVQVFVLCTLIVNYYIV